MKLSRWVVCGSVDAGVGQCANVAFAQPAFARQKDQATAQIFEVPEKKGLVVACHPSLAAMPAVFADWSRVAHESRAPA